MTKEEVIIIGSGPAGLTAALYAARANLRPLVLAGDLLGGQIALTSEVENYPGFPEGLTGPELVELMKAQAERFGTRIEYDSVVEVDFSQGSPFYLKTYSAEYQADAVIVAIGASPRRLHIPGEEEFVGRGVSYCGTCDGFFFRGKEVVVVGGGDSALEEAIFLTKFASKVTIVHRRNELRGGATLQKRATANEKIQFVWNTVVKAIEGDGSVRQVRLHNNQTGETSDFRTDGVFVFIGHDPNNQLFAGQLALDDAGYVIADRQMRTSVKGVFAAGEIQDKLYRQIATSVGQGCAAGMMCERWLAERE
jgi:thioredoxin reductase (NADPH)